MKCFYCSKTISKLDNYCTLTSNSRGKKVNEDHWHQQCWIDWLNEKFDKKMKEYAQGMLNTSVPIVEKAFIERGIIA